MRQMSDMIEMQTRGAGLFEFTAGVASFVDRSGIREGLLTLLCQHTSASLLIQENADPDVQTDLLHYFNKIAPQNDPDYVHVFEGPDDMPGHIKTALTNVHLSVPVFDGMMVLGTWQGIYLFEHRTRPHLRRVALHIIGED